MKKILFSLCLSTMAFFAAAASNVLNVDKVNNLDAPGAILNADLPWHGNFTKLLHMTPADVQTRFKIAHDNRNLYLAIEAYDDMSKIVCEKYPHDHRPVPATTILPLILTPMAAI